MPIYLNYIQKQKLCSVCKYLEDEAEKDRNFLSEVVIGDESLIDRNPIKGTKNLEDSSSNTGGASVMKLMLQRFFKQWVKCWVQCVNLKRREPTSK